jgi:ATP-dependent RNA helicase DeaD
MNFSELNLHPAVAKALAARKYETATGVQAAVLDPAVAGRDLLVSSQTGSGKTIAFGVILAETLLGLPGSETAAPPPAPMPAYGKSRGEPAALVIVPTRELATQVRGELAWLLADTRLRLASFTGGTPVSGDLRTLERGVDVVIGTPGRLVDLLRRERLPLGGLKAVVLDEADEMLDLGFREDLETILKAAPAERRTLLLSATIPPEIRAMAKRFQRDALPIDPRRAEGGGGRTEAHEDISYVAHLVSGADRLGAVVNVLRASDSQRAIVFVTTRESVSELHAALVARGFAATAISGDRAQAERDRALDQLRRGEVRILVATNVAARGLHLPDVDLIVHADLPLNAESLTHRSGRTGRAGRKGTAVIISTPAERRKAERLMMTAHVKPVWTPLPSRDAIAAAARERLATELLTPVVDDQPALAEGADALALRLEADLPAPELIRRLLARELARLPAGEAVHTVAAPRFEAERGFGARDGGGFGARNERPHPRDRAELSKEAVLFRVNIGAKDNADPRWMLPLICRRGGVTRREVGAIRIGPHETTFEIAGHAAPEFADAAAESDPRARHVIISRGDAGPAAPTPAPERSPTRREEPARHQAAPARAPAPERPLPKRGDGFTPHTIRSEHAPKRRDGFAPFAPARDNRPPQHEPGQSVKPEPHSASVKPEPHPASVHPPKPHAAAKPRPNAKPYPGAKPHAHAKPYPKPFAKPFAGAKPHAHAKPAYVKPSYMKPSSSSPKAHARPKDKHRKG